ncbi:hypothetical protein GOBAR_AA02886 [Gossypium barbadense]|uniref:Rhamnogalacturonan lyase domain-containing protein n=1 Tax=Gossypium barbadense TaxID=3634 RepID=A0A2P5YQ13_GOSBA|nr:hypothetical protein GOBAR_AA02886 [Gossypium barbadense]
MEKVAHRSHLGQLFLWLLMIVELSLFYSACSAEIPVRKILNLGDCNPHVRLQKSHHNVVIDNGLIEVTIENPSGHVTGIKYMGMDNVLECGNPNSNRGYWDFVWDNSTFDKMETKHVKVVAHTDELVEISFTKNWDFRTDHGKTVPLNIDKRFIVRRGVPGVYMYGIFERQEDFPDAQMYQLRIVFKLKEDKFRFMAISDTRQGVMPRGEDRDNTRSQTLAFKEAVLMTNPSNPQFRGEVDDKYQYSCENKDNKLHGWISDDDAVGFWIITPSNEFRTGGPHKQDLTSHVGPIAISDVTYKKGEAWRKAFGPVLIYLNSASSDDDCRKTLWNDAKRQLSEEIESWPYNFTRSEDLPHAGDRGEVCGQLLVRDRCVDEELMQAQSAFVGLAVPGNVGSWQTEGKNKVNLGTLIYDPPRNGHTLWEIGIPDRTAAEFFIPEPDPTFVNPLCLDAADNPNISTQISPTYHALQRTDSDSTDCGIATQIFIVTVMSSTLWASAIILGIGSLLMFSDVNEKGNYTLQLALAAASYAELQIRFNNLDAIQPCFTTTRIGYDNAVARHGIHGLYRLYSINIPGNRFIRGNNTIFLTQSRSHALFDAVMYDYIRLEGPAV